MIAPQTLAEIQAQVAAVGATEAGLSELRRSWPGIHFTCCSEDDIPARLRPFAEGEGFDLYLVSNAEHCIAFTDRPEAATGLVLAAQSEE